MVGVMFFFCLVSSNHRELKKFAPKIALPSGIAVSHFAGQPEDRWVVARGVILEQIDMRPRVHASRATFPPRVPL